ncbi:FMC1 [Branchiostoma lanceolatum]|uniref:Protein FMC1 homolog n=2 Tax=Branchiostoma lanceolatum TaxID=7740 RepID=A0A8J9Z033_BRALA|nr:FMC1 [Branchiostoma lanceolatum]
MLVQSKMATSMERLRVLRGLIRELRHVHKKGPVKETIAYNYLMEQYRKHQVTDQRVCRAHQELQRNAETYLCLLTSTRLQQALHDEYYGKGEKTTEETAKMLGFELPQNPPDK